MRKHIHYFSKDLLITLISLFILNGCKNPDLVGLPGQDPLDGAFTDSIPIISYSVKEDSIFTANGTRSLLGYFNDPVLGITQANIITQVLPSKDQVDFGDSLVLDSVVLSLAYSGFYGDEASEFTVKVQELKTDLKIDTPYYSNSKFLFDDTKVLGAKTFVAKPKDSLKIQLIRKGKTDTVQKVHPQLRVRLDDAFGNSLLTLSGKTELGSAENFVKYFKGLYLSVDKKVNNANGGLMYFDLNSATRSNLTLYYRSGTDTLSFNFLLNNSCAKANQYLHDYSGTPVAEQLADSTKGQQVFYIQPLAGLRAKIAFPNLNELNRSGKVSINKSELILSIEGGSDAVYAAPSTLYLLSRTETGSVITVGTASLLGKQYKFFINGYLQDKLSGKLKEKELFLLPFSGDDTANRAAIGGNGSSGYKLKLNLTYTEIN